MKKIIIIGLFLIVVIVLVVLFQKKQVKKKEELKTFGGVDKEQFKRDVQKAWKDKYINGIISYIDNGKDGGKDWKQKILDKGIIEGTPEYDNALYDAGLWSWNVEPRKAWGTVWSQGWLTETYVKGVLKIDPISNELMDILKTI